jgi:energy-coupling factor transporter ATP-binding protein EcfA2
MASLFISHNSADNEIAARLSRWLEREGYGAVFLDFDPERGIQPGIDWERELYAQLRAADAVVFLNSPAAVASRWCFAELALARSIGRTIIPVLVADGPLHPLLGPTQSLDLSSETDLAYDRLRRALRTHALDPDWSTGWDRTRAPYPGLEAFAPEDAAVFFGRDTEINDLVRRLQPTLQRGAHRLIAVVGPSGSGKSSLVRAGVVSRLRRRGGWIVPAPMRPGEGPVRNLARVLASEVGRQATIDSIEKRLEASTSGLLDIFREVCQPMGGDNPSLLLVIDQAEELATLTKPDARSSFLDLLRQALVVEVPLWVVATVRSEFLDAVLADADLAGVFNEPYLLGPLTRDRLFEVVQRPALRAGVDMDAALVARIVDDTQGGDALPLLAYTLRRLWERCIPDRPGGPIAMSDYDAVGGVVGALKQQADEIMDELRRRGQGDLVLSTLTRLVTLDARGEPTRQRVPREAFGDVDEIVPAFVEARLLTTSREPGGPATVEVAHEALLRHWPPLREAIEEARTDMKTRSQLEQLALDWEQSAQRNDYLLRGIRLHEALDWADRHEQELKSLPHVRAYLDAGRRRLQPAPAPEPAHYDELAVRLLQGRMVALMLGPRVNDVDGGPMRDGASRLAPASDELAVELARRYGLDPERLDLPDVAQEVSTREGKRELERELGVLLSEPCQPGPVQRFLAALPKLLAEREVDRRFQTIITFNFDATLEQAFAEASEPYDLLTYVTGEADRPALVHYPWSAEPEIIGDPGRYLRLPIDDLGMPLRTVIVKPLGGVRADRSDNRRDRFIVTSDEVDEHLTARGISELLPVQLVAVLRDSDLLFIGHRPRDRSVHFMMRGLRTRGNLAWVVDRNADVEDKRTWGSQHVAAYAVDPGDYVAALGRRLAQHGVERPEGSTTMPVPLSPVPFDDHTAPTSPFLGLDAYGEQQQDWFFGREQERASLLATLRAQPLTVLYGPSGVGKTSLLRAGVITRLREIAERRVAENRPAAAVPVWFSEWGAHPLEALIARIGEAIVPAELPAANHHTSLSDAINAAAAASDARLHIMLDQFEEYVMLHRIPEYERFAAELARCVNDREMPAHILIAIREDAFPALGEIFRGQISNIYLNTVALDHLDREAARRAITGPLEHYNVGAPPDEQMMIEPGLIDTLLDETFAFGGIGGNDEPRVAASLLQLMLQAAWEEARVRRSAVLTLEIIHSLGLRAVALLETQLEHALGTFSADDRDVALAVLGGLITPTGMKIAQTLPDLSTAVEYSEATVGAVLEQLSRERLVRPLAAGPGESQPRYEIYHGVLLPVIQRAIESAKDVRPTERRPRRRWWTTGRVP